MFNIDCLNGDVSKYLWVDVSGNWERTTEPRGRYAIFLVVGRVGFMRGEGFDIRSEDYMIYMARRESSFVF